jgi:hypothetical protein
MDLARSTLPKQVKSCQLSFVIYSNKVQIAGKVQCYRQNQQCSGFDFSTDGRVNPDLITMQDCWAIGSYIR